MYHYSNYKTLFVSESFRVPFQGRSIADACTHQMIPGPIWPNAPNGTTTYTATEVRENAEIPDNAPVRSAVELCTSTPTTKWAELESGEVQERQQCPGCSDLLFVCWWLKTREQENLFIININYILISLSLSFLFLPLFFLSLFLSLFYKELIL